MFDPLPSIDELKGALGNPHHPIGMRMRACYYLKQLHTNHRDDPTLQEEIIAILTSNLQVRSHGSLLRHEIGYCLGQMQDDRACHVLHDILQSTTDCEMVRHEAAEALAAIGNEALSRPVLEQVVRLSEQQATTNDDTTTATAAVPPEVRDTCRLALSVMDWRRNQKLRTSANTKNDGTTNDLPLTVGCPCMFGTVDPAPSYGQEPKTSNTNNKTKQTTKSNSELQLVLQNSKLDMFERYRALFSLRNNHATQELCNALQTDTSSPLLRHEIAYVLGQLQDPLAIPTLQERMESTTEHVMVRHEAAEALGAMETEWTRVSTMLQDFINRHSNNTNVDKNHETQNTVLQAIVESCMVALDAGEYFGHGRNQGDDEADQEQEEIDAKEDDAVKPSTMPSSPLSSFAQHKAHSSTKQPQVASCSS